MSLKHRRSGRFRARLALSLGVFAFVAVQAAAFAHFSVDPWAWRDPLYADKLERLKKGWEPTVLALGSSRTVFGLKADELSPDPVWLLKNGQDDFGWPTTTFNFGVSGGGPITQAVIWRRLQAEGVRPKVLIVEVVPNFLARDAEGGLPESRWLSGKRLTVDECTWAGSFGWQDRGVRDGSTALLPAFGFRSGLLARIAPGWVRQESRQDAHRNADAAGWVPSPTTANREIARERTRRQYADLLGEHGLHPGAVSALEILIADVRAEGVVPVLLLMPEDSEFRASLAHDFRSTIDAWLRQTGATVVDARDWVADDEFRDGHHLSPAGATMFTDRLRATLRSNGTLGDVSK